MKISTPNCPEWLAERKEFWQELDGNMRSDDTKEMNETLVAQKRWFIDGDLQPLMDNPESLSKQDALALTNVLEFCPCTDINEFTQFFKDYCNYLSQEKLGYWGLWYQRRDKKFIEDMLRRFSTDNSMSSAQLQGHFLSLLLPDESGKVTFPFVIGIDNWQPTAKVSLSEKVGDLLYSLNRYLFGDEEDSNNYAHLTKALPFIKQNLHNIAPIFFATELLEEEYIKEDGERVNQFGQQMLREVLGRLAGYDVEDEITYHHDLEIEAELREAFENADMPKEYHQLMEFIHLHKEDCVDPV